MPTEDRCVHSSGVTAICSCELPDLGTRNNPPEEQQGLLTIGSSLYIPVLL